MTEKTFTIGEDGYIHMRNLSTIKTAMHVLMGLLNSEILDRGVSSDIFNKLCELEETHLKIIDIVEDDKADIFQYRK